MSCRALPSARSLLPSLLIALGACYTPRGARVPLVIPFSPIEGAAPSVPQGISFSGFFGDGLWGQEQERAEIRGYGGGFALADRVEFTIGSFHSTKEVEGVEGRDLDGPDVETTALKVRLLDLGSRRMTVGFRVAASRASRHELEGTVGAGQHDELDVWDLSLPVEVRWVGDEGFWSFVAGYAAPRFVRQEFRSFEQEDTGTAWGLSVGFKTVRKWVGVVTEATLIRTADLKVGGYGSNPGWTFLPSIAGKIYLAFGDQGPTAGGAP